MKGKFKTQKEEMLYIYKRFKHNDYLLDKKFFEVFSLKDVLEVLSELED